MQLSDDPDDWVWVRWQWARPGARVLPFMHSFTFGLWNDVRRNPMAGPHVSMLGGRYAQTQTSKYPGGHFEGRPEWYIDGLPKSARADVDAADVCGGVALGPAAGVGLAAGVSFGAEGREDAAALFGLAAAAASAGHGSTGPGAAPGLALGVGLVGHGAARPSTAVGLALGVGMTGEGELGPSAAPGLAAAVGLTYPEPEMLATSLVGQYTWANPSGAVLPSGAWNFIDATSGSPYVFLPAPAPGRMVGFLVTRGSTRAVTVNSSGGEYIDGLTSRTVWAGEDAVLMSDGTNWYKVAGRSRPMGAALAAAANQTSVPSSTLTAVVLGTSVADPSGLMADTAGSQIHIIRDGTYLIGGVAYWQAFSAASTSTFSIVYKTGGISIGDNQKRMDTSEAGGPVAAFQRNMTAGEVLYLVGYQTSGFSQTLVGGSGSSRSVLWAQETLTW